MEEYYIRKEGDEDSRGPFTLEQLSSLAEAGQVDKETYYYEATSEQWMQIGANEPLTSSLFPEKKKLKIKPKEEIATLNIKREEDAPITVNEMLAAAEGLTKDTADKRDPAHAEAFAALIGLRVAAVILLASAVGLIGRNFEAVAAQDFGKLLTSPLFIFGAVDLLLSIGLFLQATSLYPLVRFRAAFGVGFFGFYFWALGVPPLVWASVASAIALYCCTLFVNLWLVVVTALVGLGAIAGFDYLLLH